MRYLLDTNVLSDPLSPAPDRKLTAKLRKYSGDLCTASVVLHELRFGASRLPLSRRRETIERYLESVVEATLTILPYDAKAASWHGIERARLEKAGKAPSFADGQIAAIAAVHGLTLVTRNVSDFTIFKGLRVENWFG
jgi:tRNA(fMet)-specific endonuclease VapC